MAIEVDGYQFHENKPEQLARDDVKNSIFGTLKCPYFVCRRLVTAKRTLSATNSTQLWQAKILQS
ncbi:MAG: hypothetical protein U5O16_28650 [Rhodococcus sp. (in: high G+C Gram-positive bacteria)]|uniref:hypothetical protein n=1 Tax=Rhodococcus sp. TaxID=1831 RepID=UPI002AD99EED|nr:hypothetical protein [Rhodococcus sp. (in: high G+C Gram-positive bacteria)]